MADFSIDEKVNLLIKQYFNKPSTRDSLDFFAEPSYRQDSIFSTQIWQQADNIPINGPPSDIIGNGASGSLNDLKYPLLGTNGTTINDNRFGLTSTSNPIIAVFVNITTTYVSGTNYTFKVALDPNGDSTIQDAIPFNYGNFGRYNYILRDADGVKIPFGSDGGYWVVDSQSGYITFYGVIDAQYNVDANNTPTISFLKYVGTKGVGSSSATQGVTIQETDGSPLLENTTLIKFNTEHADFVINQNGSNTVDIDLQSKSFAIGQTYGVTKPDVNNLIIEGNVGIGLTHPEYALHINGLIWSSSGTGGGSDIRWKTNFSEIINPLNDISKIRGLYFDWKHNDPIMKFPKNRQIGVIAQEVEKVYPELVYTDKNGYKSVAYDKLSAVLLESVKQLQLHNCKLENRLESLENKLQHLL